METSVLMPAVGTNSTQGSVTSWLRRDGAYVHTWDPFVEVVLDNGVETVLLAPASGFLTHHVTPGAAAAIGQPIGSIAAEAQPGAFIEAKKDGAGPSHPVPISAERAQDAYEALTCEADVTAMQKMETAVLLPALGTNSGQGSVTSWLHSDGAYVHTWDPLVEVVLDNEVETILLAPASGFLTHHVTPGAAAAIGQPIGYIAAEAQPGAFIEAKKDGVRQSHSHPISAERAQDAYEALTCEADLTAIRSLLCSYSRGFRAIEGVELTEHTFVARAVTEALRTYTQFRPPKHTANQPEQDYASVTLAISPTASVDDQVTVKDAHHLSLAGIAHAIRGNGKTPQTESPGASAPGFSIVSLSGSEFPNDARRAGVSVPAVFGFGHVTQTLPASDDAGPKNIINLNLLFNRQVFSSKEALQFLSLVKDRLENAQFEPELRYTSRG